MIAVKLAALVLAASPVSSLAISPPHIATLSQPGSVTHVTVYDMSKSRERVTMNAAPVARQSDGACRVTAGTAPYVSVTPSRFTLRSGHRRIVTVRTLGDKRYPGRHDVAILATTSLAGNGQVHLSEAVGAQMLVALPGHTAKGYKPCLTLSAPAKSDFPWTLVIALVIAFVIGGILAAVHTARRRGAHQQG